jgi:tetratricopeptide (TPR) repeat protein
MPKVTRQRVIVAILLVLVLGGVALLAVPRLKKRSERSYNKAMLYLRGGKWPEAIGCLRSALRTLPEKGYEDPRLTPRHVQAQIVETYLLAGDPASALAELPALTQMGASAAEVELLRAKVFRARADQRVRAAGALLDAELCDSVIKDDVQPAIASITQQADSAPEPAAAYHELGRLYSLMTDLLTPKRSWLARQAELARSLTRQEEADARQAQADAVVADIREAQRKAALAYTRAIELDPGQWPPRVALARILLGASVSQLGRAREVLSPIIEHEPQHRDARLLLARVERIAGNYDKALEHVSGARREGSADFDLLVEQVQILTAAGRWSEAQAPSAEAVRLKPRDPMACYCRGLVLLHEEDPAKRPVALAEAVTDLQNIFEEEGRRWPRARFVLAQGLLAQGQTQQAVGAFRKALTEASDTSGGSTGEQMDLLSVLQGFPASFWTDMAAALQADDPQKAAQHEASAALLRARLMSVRATYRWQAAERGLTVELCDSILAKDVGPALEFAEQYVAQAERLAQAYTLLGGLYAQRHTFLKAKAELMAARARVLARTPGREEEAGARRADVFALLGDMGGAQRAAENAYGKAVRLDPTLDAPRLAIAASALTPIEDVRKMVEPIVKREPRNRDARLLLANSERVAGNYDAALAHVRALQQEGVDDADLVRAETEILVDAKRWAEAEPTSAKFLRLQPDSPRAAYLRGLVLLNQDRPGEAVQVLRPQASVLLPQARLVLAQGLFKLGKRDEAIAAFKQALEDVEAAGTGAALIGQWPELQQVEYEGGLVLARELVGQSPQEAAAYGRRALEVSPERREAYEAVRSAQKAAGLSGGQVEEVALLHARALAVRGQMDEALGVCEGELKGMGQGQGQGVRLLRAALLAGKGSYREAEEEYRRLWEEGQVGAGRDLARMYVRLGRDGEARGVYEELVKREPQDVEAVGGLVSLLRRQRDVDGARKVLEEAEGRLGREKVRGYLMELYVRQGRWAEALELARGQVEAQPGDVGAKVVLADLQWQAGDEQGAQETYKKVLEADPQHVGGYRLGLLELTQGRFEEALEVFREGRRRHPGDVGMTVSLALAMQAAGRPEEAVPLLAEGLDSGGPSGDERVPWYLAVIYAGLGKASDATSLSGRVRTASLGWPEDREALLTRLAGAEEAQRKGAAAAMNLAAAFSMAGCPPAALAQLQALEKLLPGEALPSCWHAALLDRLGDHEGAVSKYELVIRDQPDLVFARVGLALSHLSHGDTDKGVGVLEEALPHASAPAAADISLRLAGLYEQQGRFEAAISAYEAAMNEPATAPIAYNNLAGILATRRNDPVAARPLAERALQLTGGDPRVVDTLGWICYLQGDAAKAIELLEKARAALPSLPTVRYHLAVAYLKAGRRAEAKAELEEALAISRTFPEAEAAAAALATL